MSTAWAQVGDPASGPPAAYNIGFILLMIGIFYFVLLRPEQKRRKEQQTLIDSVKRNDQIVLNSGMHGRVVALAEKTITVEIAPKIQVVFDRSAIQAVQMPGSETREKEREKS
ncbi:MAG TPA: preprotein translocase subunit YajC [Candidatus Binatia bacterium]|jgi:preprotein translocase subunit YajC|nr:preprotein translocase subunit YajC [Candidatus Binatia bacterium]